MLTIEGMEIFCNSKTVDSQPKGQQLTSAIDSAKKPTALQNSQAAKPITNRTMNIGSCQEQPINSISDIPQEITLHNYVTLVYVSRQNVLQQWNF